MEQITYTITDPMGIHARPAGQLVKMAAAFDCNIEIGTSAKMVDARRIMAVMGLALKQGDEIIITLDGPDESAAAKDFETFLQSNL